MKYNPFCDTEIVFTNLETLKERLLSIEMSNIVLVMSESSAKRWEMISFINQWQEKCENQKGVFIWIKNIKPNPNPKDIIDALIQIGNNAIDLIIAVGGGSVIDLAKAISLFHKGDSARAYTVDKITCSIKEKEYQEIRFIDIIAIPSTAGTGSEVTQWATIWDENKKSKYSIDHPRLKPKMAFILPELTVNMGSKLTLATGLDAMCQAIEAYWSRHTTPLVQEIAYRAIAIGIQNLRQAVDEPMDFTVRENLCKASVLAGLAFAQTRTTACHSISYPLTMFFDVPHGLAAAITLDAVGEINKGNFPNDIALFRLFEDYAGIGGFINYACAGIIDMKLSAFGITLNDIPVIVKHAFTGGRMDNNPVDLTENDVTSILKSVM